jgi:hypothetical protein
MKTGFGGIGAGSHNGRGYCDGSHSRSLGRKEAQSGFSYRMSKLKSASRSAGAAEGDEIELSRPSYTHQPVVNGFTGQPEALTSMQSSQYSANKDGTNRDGTGIASDESRRVMIQKQVQCTVTSGSRV